jgi:predicted MPP superfamily phosphohydrolase
MRGGSPLFLLSIVAFLVVVDIYTFRGIRILTGNFEGYIRYAIYALFWLVPVIILLIMLYMTHNTRIFFTTGKFRVWYFLMGIFVLFYIPKLVFIAFQLGNDLVRIGGYLLSRLSSPDTRVAHAAEIMSRAEFLTRAGIIVSIVPFLSILQGIVRGRYNYKVKQIALNFENFPMAFNGMRVLQISDWHIGSFLGQPDRVKEAVDLINSQNADIILFTGDIVNNVAEELEEFIPQLQQLSAPYGVYSILGNHDYGEYVHWNSEEAHADNMERLFHFQEKAGFRLLRNESFILEKEGEQIGIAGVENWGLPPFPQYGDLQESRKNIESASFKILMSHDPSHWDAEVHGKSDFDLTLSGHTHGMQFGINIPGIKWSPIKWKYPRWSGLYNEGKQYLYVNVGIGYIGFPGRVGFYPEITVFELRNQEKTA